MQLWAFPSVGPRKKEKEGMQRLKKPQDSLRFRPRCCEKCRKSRPSSDLEPEYRITRKEGRMGRSGAEKSRLVRGQLVQ